MHGTRQPICQKRLRGGAGQRCTIHALRKQMHYHAYWESAAHTAAEMGTLAMTRNHFYVAATLTICSTITLEHASQILTLHQTKPKFKSLLIGLPGHKNDMTHHNFLYWIERVFCGELNRVVMHHNAPDSTRTQALSTLMVVQELSESLLRGSGSDVFKAGLPIKLDPRNYIGLVVQPRIAR